MEIKYTTYRINLKHSFGISRSSHDFYDIVYFYIVDGEIIGRGEAAPSKRYNETTEKIISVLDKGILVPENFEDADQLWEYIKPQLEGISALEAAVNMAIWDWRGQKENKAVHDILGFNVSKLPITSYTISIGNMSELDEKIELSLRMYILGISAYYHDSAACILKDGKINEVPCFEGYEIIDFGDKLGKLEASVTSGGLSTMPWTFEDKLDILEKLTTYVLRPNTNQIFQRVHLSLQNIQVHPGYQF